MGTGLNALSQANPPRGLKSRAILEVARRLVRACSLSTGGMPPAQARRLLSARVFQVWQIYPMNLRICLKRFPCWKRKRAPEATDPPRN